MSDLVIETLVRVRNFDAAELDLLEKCVTERRGQLSHITEILPPTGVERLDTYYKQCTFDLDTVTYAGEQLFPLYMKWVDEVQLWLERECQEVYFGYVYASYDPRDDRDIDMFQMGFDVFTDDGPRCVLINLEVDRRDKSIRTKVIEHDGEGLFYEAAPYSFDNHGCDVLHLRLD